MSTKTTMIASFLLAIPLAAGLMSMPTFASDACMRGEVTAYDFAELTQNFKDGLWDKAGGIALKSDYAELTLKVLAPSGASVCENIADLNTKCDFKLRNGDDFTVIVDNSARSSATSYELCAY